MKTIIDAFQNMVLNLVALFLAYPLIILAAAAIVCALVLVMDKMDRRSKR